MLQPARASASSRNENARRTRRMRRVYHRAVKIPLNPRILWHFSECREADPRHFRAPIFTKCEGASVMIAHR
jgi:hypothetical protein